MWQCYVHIGVVVGGHVQQKVSSSGTVFLPGFLWESSWKIWTANDDSLALQHNDTALPMSSMVSCSFELFLVVMVPKF